MNLRKNRRLNPRTGPVVIGWLFVGVLTASAFLYGWAQFTLTRMQRQCLPLYIETSAPSIHFAGKTFLDTVSRNGIRRALGENVDPQDKSRVSKAPIYGTLHDLIYKGQPLSKMAKLPCEIAAGIVLAFFIFGAVRANQQRRSLENGIVLRGPELMNIRQFNKAARGKIGIEIHAHEVIKS